MYQSTPWYTKKPFTDGKTGDGLEIRSGLSRSLIRADGDAIEPVDEGGEG